MEGVNNCKYSLHFLMSLRKCAAQLSGNIKQTLESIGIVRKRSRARGSRAGKNRRQKITIIEGHRPKPKHRSKRERVITEICFEKCYSEHSKRERTRMPKLTLCNTWAHDDIPDESLSVRDCRLFGRDRTNGGSGGGVAVCCHGRLQAEGREDLESDDAGCVWVQLRPRRTPSSVSTSKPPDADAVSSIRSAALPVASRIRHQSAATMVRNIAGNIARLWHTVRDGKRGADPSLLRPFQRSAVQSHIKTELFNAQSLANKSSLIHEHILDKDIDLMCLTETWHQPDVFSSLNEACPPGYSYLQRARCTGRGGGLAVIYRNTLKLSPLSLPGVSSFEYLAFNSKPPSKINAILIYRPPKPHPSFITELHDLLTSFCSLSSNNIILGDMNIHIDNPSSPLAADFLHILDCLNLTQHVDAPTHTRGHTLDLVISDLPSIKNLSVYDLGVSDHSIVSMDISCPLPPPQPKRNIHFRNIKNINTASLHSDLQLLSSVNHPSANESVEHYNLSLRCLLDKHAPLKTRTVSFSRSAPWFTDELRKMKAAGRAIERRVKSSGLVVHKLAYKDHQKAYAAALKEARSIHYSNIINNSPGNSKQLFSTINHLLNPQNQTHTEFTAENCNRFLSFFKDKINSIRSQLSGSPAPPLPSASLEPALLTTFATVTQREVEGFIKKMKPSTSPLDPFPTTLIKSNLSVISPLITQIINHSLNSGHVPPTLKAAVIKPLLKKPNLDPECLSNYRPISHLPFLSKVLEKAVAAQLQDHLQRHSLFETFQSGFRTAHSTETALLRVTNDILISADSGSPSLLILLDLSAAFDTVDHHILLNRLHSDIGLHHSTLDWFISYLADRTEYVSLGPARSQTASVTCGVPQGSVLGPILFILYMLPLGQVIRRHGISFHCYADDTQLYLRTDSNPRSTPVLSPPPSLALSNCLEEIRVWMSHNFLQLNSSKTEAILIGTPHQVQSSTITTISFSGQDIPLSTSVTNLGVKLDPQLTFVNHIKHLYKTCFFHIKNISKLRPFLSFSDAEKLIHALISSRLDYCNSLLIGIPNKHIQKLQFIQNCAARTLMKTRKYEHITPILQNLHWLPINSRIQYKIALITHLCIHNNAPQYLKDLLTPHAPTRSLRSQSTYLLKQPCTKLRTMGDRAFSSAAPHIWNSLPELLRQLQSTDTFKKGLKTFLFRQAFLGGH